MTPATPPSSREHRSSSKPTLTTFENELIRRKNNPLETPKKNSQLDVPMTPSTTRPFKSSAPSLNPPGNNPSLKSPFKGFNSPEYTPYRVTQANRRPLQFEQPKGLQKISRVLFPTTDDKDTEDQNLDVCQPVLLPATDRPSSVRRRSSNDFALSQPDSYGYLQAKHSKHEPGTPSHKIITNEMARDWHNPETYEDFDNDDSSDCFLVSTSPNNPFISADIIGKETREERKRDLLLEHPDIEDVITYVDKKGTIVRRRRLSQEEKERFKPKRLFDEELKDLEFERGN